ncbi:TPA: lipopolysaccharide biosynthesis protein [Photobacterium damselae]
MTLINKELKIAALINYTSIGFTALSGILLTPFILNSVGSSDYAVYALIGSLIGTFSILTYGLSNSSTKHISQSINEKDLDKANRYVSIYLCLYAGMAAITLIFGLIFYLNLNVLISAFTQEEKALSQSIYIVVLLSFLVTLFTGVYISVLRSYQENVFIKSIELIRVVVRFSLVIGVVALGYGVYEIVLIEFTLACLFFIVIYLRAYISHKVEVRKFKFDQGELKNIAFYSGWLFLLAIYQQFIWEIPKFFEAKYSNSHSVTVLSLSIMLSLFFVMIATVISNMLLPRIVDLVHSGKNITVINNKLVDVSRVIFYLLFPVLIGFALTGDIFVNIWLGDDYSLVYKDTLIIMLVMTPVLMQLAYSTLLDVINKVKLKSIFSITILFFSMFLFVIQKKTLGIDALYFTLFSVVLVWISLNIYYVKLGYNAYLCYIPTIKQFLYSICVASFFFTIKVLAKNYV